MAEYKAKLIKGLFTKAKNVLLSNGQNVEDMLPSEIGVVETNGNARTITLDKSYTAMDYCFIQIMYGDYGGAFFPRMPIQFTAPKTVTFTIIDSSGQTAGAAYTVAYQFKGH